MNRPTFSDTLRNSQDWGDWEHLAVETMSVPLGVEWYTGERIIDTLDRTQVGWRDELLGYLENQIERRAWARKFLADRAEYYRRDPETGYSQAELRAEAESIREEEQRMRENHERDIVRGLGGKWWD